MEASQLLLIKMDMSHEAKEEAFTISSRQRLRFMVPVVWFRRLVVVTFLKAEVRKRLRISVRLLTLLLSRRAHLSPYLKRLALRRTTAAGSAWRDPMARSARVALVAALLFGGTSLATAKTRGAVHRNPFPPRITETAPRSTGVLPPEQQCCCSCDPYGHSITGNGT